jgi:hypothetical protein
MNWSSTLKRLKRTPVMKMTILSRKSLLKTHFNTSWDKIRAKEKNSSNKVSREEFIKLVNLKEKKISEKLWML